MDEGQRGGVTCLKSHSNLTKKPVYKPIFLASQSNDFVVYVSYPAGYVNVCVCVNDSWCVCVCMVQFTCEYEK